MLGGLDHPFIVKLAGTFQDGKFLYVVLEFVIGGELFSQLRKRGRFDNNCSKIYAAQIVHIFDYLHQRVRFSCTSSSHRAGV